MSRLKQQRLGRMFTRSDKASKPTFTRNPYANAMSRCFAEPLHAGNVVEKVGIDVSDKDSDNIAVWLVENAKVKEALAVYGFCLVHDRRLDRDRCVGCRVCVNKQRCSIFVEFGQLSNLTPADQLPGETSLTWRQRPSFKKTPITRAVPRASHRSCRFLSTIGSVNEASGPSVVELERCKRESFSRTLTY